MTKDIQSQSSNIYWKKDYCNDHFLYRDVSKVNEATFEVCGFGRGIETFVSRQNAMREEFALRIDKLGHRVSVHTTPKSHDMQLIQFIYVFEE